MDSDYCIRLSVHWEPDWERREGGVEETYIGDFQAVIHIPSEEQLFSRFLFSLSRIAIRLLLALGRGNGRF